MTNDGERLATRVSQDPRFLRVRKKDVKIKVDSRFERMFKDEEFGQGKQVDRYGRRREVAGSNKDLERFYQREQESQEEVEDLSSSYSSVSESESASSSASSSSDEEEAVMDEMLSAHPLVAMDAPLGEASHRLAAVNLDWEVIKAVDLFQLAHAFKPTTGLIRSVKIYASQFGKERMAREAMEGPLKELFDPSAPSENVSESDDSESDGASRQEVDEQKLRKYQLERLRYYFAVLECDSADTAAAIYRHCDGSEFEASANFLDLRFIPEEVSFAGEEATDVCLQLPKNYKAKPDIETAALQRSKVTLTWDQDDVERQKATRSLFNGTIDQEENDLRAYLASSSESDGDEDEESDDGPRERYRQLLLSGNNESVFGRKSNADDLQITFASALSAKQQKNTKKKDKLEAESDVDMEMTFAAHELLSEEDSEVHHDGQAKAEETVFEAQERKLREKKKAKKVARLTEIKERREAERQANKAAKRQPRQEDVEKRAQLELLLLDEQAEEDRHFDMREVVKAGKGKNKKNKRKAADDEVAKDAFQLDLHDSRFQAMYESPSFAIDPSNPSFKKTAAMKQVIAERQKRLKPEH